MNMKNKSAKSPKMPASKFVGTGMKASAAPKADNLKKGKKAKKMKGC